MREEDYGEDGRKEANSVIRYVLRTPDLGLVHPRLDTESSEIMVFTDATLANNSDSSSQIGFVIILRDKFGACNMLAYSSKKCRRVTHSSLTGELMAFTAGFDAAYVMKHDFEDMKRYRFPLKMMTDSRVLFDVVTRHSYCTERRMVIYRAAIHQSHA